MLCSAALDAEDAVASDVESDASEDGRGFLRLCLLGLAGNLGAWSEPRMFFQLESRESCAARGRFRLLVFSFGRAAFFAALAMALAAALAILAFSASVAAAVGGVVCFSDEGMIVCIQYADYF